MVMSDLLRAASLVLLSSAGGLALVGAGTAGTAYHPAGGAVAADTIVWYRSFGVPGRDVGGSIAPAPDGGWLVVGTERRPGERDDIRMLRLTPDGDTLWSRTCCGPGTERTSTASVAPGPDGGWLVAGLQFAGPERHYDVLVMALDSTGRALWSRTYGAPGRDALESVRRTVDSGYILAGGTALPGSAAETPWVLRIDGRGDTVWSRTYPGPGNGHVEAAVQSAGGGFVLAGTQGDGPEYPMDLVVRKLTPAGHTAWSWTYGGPRIHVWPEWLVPAPDGGWLVAGVHCEPCSPDTRPYDGRFDAFVARLTADGDTLWTRRLGGAGNDLAYFVETTRRGTYMVGGATTPDGGETDTPWLVELNDRGDSVWSRTLPNAFPRNGVAQVREVAPDEFLVTGPPWLYQRGDQADLWVLRLRRE